MVMRLPLDASATPKGCGFDPRRRARRTARRGVRTANPPHSCLGGVCGQDKIPRVQLPMLFLSGSMDRVVPKAQMRRLYEARIRPSGHADFCPPWPPLRWWGGFPPRYHAPSTATNE